MKTIIAFLAACGILFGVAIIVAMATIDMIIDFDEYEYEDDDEEF